MSWNDFVFFPDLIVEITGVIVLVIGIFTAEPALLIIGVVLICIALAIISFRSYGGFMPDPPDRIRVYMLR
jgi:uncharacterized membrane protein YphA (DoxX/SURF4 family)